MREQATIIDVILAERIEEVVPMLMRREGIDAWEDIPEWDSEPLSMKLEEYAFWNGENFYYIQPR